MPTRRSVLIALPGLALAATGCAHRGKVGGALSRWLPKVRFDRLKVRDIDFERAKLSFIFEVDNPAPLKVDIAGLTYDLALEGQRLFEGEAREGLELEPEGTAELRFPFTLRWDDVRSLLKETRGQDELGFRLTGTMGFDTPAGLARLPYDASGSLPALRTPRFELAGIELRSFQPTRDRAELGVRLRATNLGGAGIGFQSFDYTLRLAGERVATGLVRRAGDVAGGATETLTVPVDLRLSSLGNSVVEAIRGGGEIGARLTASLEVSTPFGAVPLDIDERGRVDLIEQAGLSRGG